jgi:hypothetical protein
MSAAPDDRCARCGGAFHCGMNDEHPCACTGVTLQAATLADLRHRYSGCLCLRCLQALAAPAPVSPTPCG